MDLKELLFHLKNVVTGTVSVNLKDDWVQKVSSFKSFKDLINTISWILFSELPGHFCWTVVIPVDHCLYDLFWGILQKVGMRDMTLNALEMELCLFGQTHQFDV